MSATPAPLPTYADASWWERAACRGHRHPDWWGGPCYTLGPRTTRHLTARTQLAIVVCCGCKVRAQCLAEALRMPEQVGLWGGLTDQERLEPEHERAAILQERYGSA